MEENVKKSVEQESTAETQKLTYEQLEEVAHQLSEQSKQLYAKLQEANMSNLMKRLDYLFKVIENELHFDEEFVASCTAEIKEMMTIPKAEEEEKSE